MFITGLGLGP